jgi:hypothetical protein
MLVEQADPEPRKFSMFLQDTLEISKTRFVLARARYNFIDIFQTGIGNCSFHERSLTRFESNYKDEGKGWSEA